MDMLDILRAAGGLATVLGLLAGAVWLMRRYKLTWPGMGSGRKEARLSIIERVAVDQRRSIVLIRRDGREHLVLIGPEAPLLIEAGIRSPLDPQERSAAPATFASILQSVRSQTVDA